VSELLSACSLICSNEPRLATCFPPRRPRFEPRPGNVRFLVDKMTLGHVSSEYFGINCQFSFHRVLHIHHHLSSGAGTIGQLVDDISSGLSLAPPEESKKKLTKNGPAVVARQGKTNDARLYGKRRPAVNGITGSSTSVCKAG
jgi:hypothetical protein